MKKHTYLTVFILSISILDCFAQEPQLSLFYALPTYMSPSFAGGVHHHRTIVHARNQWPGNDATYRTMFVSYDTYYAHRKMGIGGIIMHDNQGNSNFNTTSFDFQAAYDLHLNSKYTVRPGMQLGMMNRELKTNYIYGNQIDPIWGFDNKLSSGEGQIFGSQLLPTVAASALLFHANYWVGIAGHQLNRPNQSMINGVSRLPAKLNIHGGIKFRLNKHEHHDYLSDEREISITPVFHYKAQNKSNQLDLGVYSIYDQLLLGIWYRGIPLIKNYERNFMNNDAMVFMIGWNYKSLTTSISYDKTVSKLNGYTNGAYEINLSYIFKKKHRTGHDPLRTLPCPNLHNHHKLDYLYK